MCSQPRLALRHLRSAVMRTGKPRRAIPNSPKWVTQLLNYRQTRNPADAHHEDLPPGLHRDRDSNHRWRSAQIHTRCRPFGEALLAVLPVGFEYPVALPDSNDVPWADSGATPAGRGLCHLLGTTGRSVPVVAVINEVRKHLDN